MPAWTQFLSQIKIIHTDQVALTLGNLGLDVLDRFTLLHFDRNGLAGEGLDEELLGAST